MTDRHGNKIRVRVVEILLVSVCPRPPTSSAASVRIEWVRMQPFNRYYPPDYDGKSNINKMAGTHALGRRAHKLDQGILIVRFEMPYNIWCASCNNHIGQGVRFNAEKKRIGNYYSTPIWSFRMKCHLCSAWMEIKTDPEHTRYVIVEGAKKQSEEWDTSEQGVVQSKGTIFPGFSAMLWG